MLNCPLYILTVDPQPEDEWDIEKIHYVTRWRELAEEHGAKEFIVKYNEKRPVAKVIGEVARSRHVTADSFRPDCAKPMGRNYERLIY